MTNKKNKICDVAITRVGIQAPIIRSNVSYTTIGTRAKGQFLKRLLKQFSNKYFFFDSFMAFITQSAIKCASLWIKYCSSSKIASLGLWWNRTKTFHLALMNINIRSTDKAQFIWKQRTQSIEKFRLLASPNELQKLELVISMIGNNALYNGEIERVSEESSSDDITGKYNLLFLFKISFYYYFQTLKMINHPAMMMVKVYY